MSDVRFPAATPPAAVDVLVVGAGPVGLAAAVDLHGHGVPVAVVDAATVAPLVRAGAMGHSPRTVEHFRRWGVLQRIRDGWTFPPEWNRGIRIATSLTGHDLVTGGPRGTTDSLARPIRRPQTVLQQAFLDHLSARGVPVAGGWRVTALAETADHAEVTVESATGQTRIVRASYVIGADGARSTVRTLAGISRTGDRATEKMIRLIVRHAPGALGDAPSGTNIVLNARASGFLAAISPTEWRVYAGPYPLDAEPAPADLLATARAAFGVPDLPLEIASSTTFHHATRIASAFRSGRVLLAGDAAHVRTPGGNLGEGFGDVVNLGWKLAAVLAGRASPALLDSYDAERRPHNERVAAHALARARRTRARLHEIRRGGIPDDADLSPAAAARRAEIGALLAGDREDTPGVTFDERYDDSGIIWYEDAPGAPWRPEVYESDGRPGHRAPDGYVDPWGDTLHDRIGNRFGLLVFGRAPAGSFAAEAAARGLPFTVVHLDDPALRAAYGADLVLVRPDQHVAWRGAQPPPGGAAAVLDRAHALVPATVP